MIHSSGNKKDVNFELNLLPVFDVLSACTCFLLMTAVWISLGSFDVSQSMGGQALTNSKNPPSVWIYMNKGGQVTMTLKDVTGAPSQMREVKFNAQSGTIAWNQINKYVETMKQRLPTIKTALVMPAETTKYDDLVHIMDQFRGGGVQNIGISPL